MAAKKRKHGNGTAAKAVNWLLNQDLGFVAPTATQKKKILTAFAERNKVVYGKAYDVVKLPKKPYINLDDTQDIKDKIDKIKLFEIKSTVRDLDADFSGYFFALTTAELLVAQNLKEQYRFIFVNVKHKNYKEMSLQGVLSKAKGFYPQWSISF